ncbi:MAG: hydroxymethylbilane synthase [Algoriphagus sp.]|uniref:hydroxymethylbilane synthase n=1 Tax=Algoriphagus sp. TaxID=1872435 RepID=UPI00276CD0E8|nr:hydroxymethylbilane synthase [Algoriphagus sp.]MDP4748870.1 hydroxymethylbilane synthase [Algoriphagus sp.]MDP4839542.1 hydroxymethylbilane synthase [Algoriphagus sp.]MDP4905291.1 hydroxymethylbilane synthase [Algoriphagus sp.]MDP4957607.1 hydroxymethylbilane synthase [Algoriphagus sp.]
MSKQLVKIGTRASKLALWQAYHVADLLQKAGLSTEIVPIDTKGDQVLDVSISKIGSKGVFTQELEDQLLDGRISIAVHSAKDMPSKLGDGLELIAFSAREQAQDVLLSTNKGVSLRDANLVVGTSSTRRIATLKHFFPQVKTVEVRGNLQTRIRKMEEGHCDALLLAYAGVHRMGYESLLVEHLDLNQFIPAVGQGSIALEASTNLDPSLREAIVRACNDRQTENCLLAERAFLRVLEGGCSIPVFALATLVGNQVHLKGGIVSLDGQQRIVIEVSGPMAEGEQLGEALAKQVLEAGGKTILDQIKSSLH